MRSTLVGTLISVFVLFITASCVKQPVLDPNLINSKYLYVSTGACYSGNGNTTFTTTTAYNHVYRINMSTGVRDITIADYRQSPSNAGDSPAGIVSLDSDYLLIAVENATAGLRRIEKVEKKQLGTRQAYNSNTAALSAQIRKLRMVGDGWLLASKSTDIEKIKDGTNRLVQGTSPFIRLTNPPATSNCGTAITLIPDFISLPSGLIVVAHSATGKTGFSVISSSGYAAAADCKNNVFQSSPLATSFPTAMVYDDKNDKLLVAYAGNSASVADSNIIMAYSIDETTGTISSPQKIYDASLAATTWNSMLLYGISAMSLDESSNALYVATAISNATTVVNYRIEKITYDGTKIGVDNNSALAKDSTFYNYGSDTQCINQMLIAD